MFFLYYNTNYTITDEKTVVGNPFALALDAATP